MRAVWSGDNAAPAESYPSIADAVSSLDASALLIDFDDREGWPDGELPDDLPCPAVVISAFGREPDAPRGGNLTVAAASGVLHLTGASGDPESRPLVLHEQQTETIAGSYAALATLLAATQGSPGQLIELTKHECFSICAAGEVVKWTYAGLLPSRVGSPLFQPSAVMRASDGDLFVLCTSEEQWAPPDDGDGRPGVGELGDLRPPRPPRRELGRPRTAARRVDRGPDARRADGTRARRAAAVRLRVHTP